MRCINTLRLSISLAAITILGCSNEPPANPTTTSKEDASSPAEVATSVGKAVLATEIPGSLNSDDPETTEVDGLVDTVLKPTDTALVTMKEQGESQPAQTKLESVEENSDLADLSATKINQPESSDTIHLERAQYTVQSGDSLGAIARLHNTTVAALAITNAIDNPNIIVVGQTIRVTP